MLAGQRHPAGQVQAELVLVGFVGKGFVGPVEAAAAAVIPHGTQDVIPLNRLGQFSHAV